MVLDLDPQGEDFEPVRSTAQAFKELLDDLELPAYLKTTGSRGLHIVVPLQRREGFDAVRDFARDLARIVVSQAPGERARPGAPVSLPLDWSEHTPKEPRRTPPEQV